MAYRPRIYYSNTQKAEIWDRWQKGETLNSIGRVFDRPSSSIFNQLAPSGGIRPPIRQRSQLALSLTERETISRGIAAGQSMRTIASELNRAPSTISREIKRNGSTGQYRATHADQSAWDRACRPKPCKLSLSPSLCRIVVVKLQSNWSPQQIAGWLKREHPEDKSKHVSHETIYRSLFVQARGVLKKELQQHLRSRRAIRRSKHATLKRGGRGQIPHAVSIHERPPTVEDRAIPGHWEGDLIGGCRNSYVATLVERHTRYVVLAKVKNKDTESVISALIKQAKKMPDQLCKSLTWDRGTELTDHRRFTLETKVDVYFCDPRSPWQRGSNENTNRLLRQYLPHGTDLSLHSQTKLDAIARQLNQRPRETLGFETPAQRFNACVALTG